MIKKWIREWNRKNEFNSFNSWKGLLYKDWYEAVARGDFKPPIEASIDPIHACNLMCEHCNAARYLDKTYNMEMRSMPHLLELVGFLGEWGVKAICFGGGGEPTMHKEMVEALLMTHTYRMQASMATNGTLFTGPLVEAMVRYCRWVGVSVDAATAKTYRIGRKTDLFKTATHNIQWLARECRKPRSKCDVAFKFLIFSYNQHEIYKACKLAKELGAKDFHARPADFSHQGMGKLKQKKAKYDIEAVKAQFAKCHDLEDENFRVFTIVHKFDDTMKPRKDFSQCYAAPLCIQLCADGWVYLCPDQRHSKYYRLGRHFPNPQQIKEFWGKDRHKALVLKNGKKHCQSRCTFNPYNRQCEALFISDKDPMCWRFI